MPERKRFFSIDVFPYLVREKSQIPSENTIFAETFGELKERTEYFHLWPSLNVTHSQRFNEIEGLCEIAKEQKVSGSIWKEWKANLFPDRPSQECLTYLELAAPPPD